MNTPRKWFEEEIKDERIKNLLIVFIEYVEDRLAWYETNRKKKGLLSNLLLIIAVIGFSGSIILIAVNSPDDKVAFFQFTLNVYALSYLCLLIASTMLLLDRIFGHSSGWIRYMLAQLEIEKAISEHHSQWLGYISRIDLQNLSPENQRDLIKFLELFNDNIRTIVLKETIEWKTNLNVQLENFRSSVDSGRKQSKADLQKFREEINQKQQ